MESARELDDNLEIVDKFKIDNCSYTIRQPKREMTLEEKEDMYKVISKSIYE